MCNRDTEMKCYWYIRIAKARKLNTAHEDSCTIRPM